MEGGIPITTKEKLGKWENLSASVLINAVLPLPAFAEDYRLAREAAMALLFV